MCFVTSGSQKTLNFFYTRTAYNIKNVYQLLYLRTRITGTDMISDRVMCFVDIVQHVVAHRSHSPELKATFDTQDTQ